MKMPALKPSEKPLFFLRTRKSFAMRFKEHHCNGHASPHGLTFTNKNNLVARQTE